MKNKTDKKPYIFEFNDTDGSKTWCVLGFDGIHKNACKTFELEGMPLWGYNRNKKEADKFVRNFLKDGGNHYQYNLPWKLFRRIRYLNILPDKPLNELEEYRVSPKPSAILEIEKVAHELAGYGYAKENGVTYKHILPQIYSHLEDTNSQFHSFDVDWNNMKVVFNETNLPEALKAYKDIWNYIEEQYEEGKKTADTITVDMEDFEDTTRRDVDKYISENGLDESRSEEIFDALLDYLLKNVLTVTKEDRDTGEILEVSFGLAAVDKGEQKFFEEFTEQNEMTVTRSI